jgi:8-oxo-dGTP diphosphatase
MRKQQPQVKAGVGVIVIRDNKVLVGERAGSHGAGCLAFPGGHLDPEDRSLKACGEREVFEETGIICNVYAPDHYREELFTTFDILSEDGQKVYVTAYLVADYLHGGTILTTGNREGVQPLEEKCKAWYWMTLAELAEAVKTEKAKQWIPINKVLYYLKQLGLK